VSGFDQLKKNLDCFGSFLRVNPLASAMISTISRLVSAMVGTPSGNGWSDSGSVLILRVGFGNNQIRDRFMNNKIFD